MRRRLISEMEVRQQTEKEELQRLQQEVESQRKESEEVQQRILQQEERLQLRSLAVENHLRLLLAQRERSSDGQEARAEEAAERAEVHRELALLQAQREEQAAGLQGELRRLEEQEEGQRLLVGRLGEELRDKREAAALALPPRDARRQEEEHRALTQIREALLRAKEAGGQGGEEGEEEEGTEGNDRVVREVQARYRRFKEVQVKELTELEEELRKQKERPEEEEQTASRGQRESEDDEERRRHKESQLAGLARERLRLLGEERRRAVELLQGSSPLTNGNAGAVTEGNPGAAGLESTLHAVEEELREKEERMRRLRRSEEELRQLQETYEFAADVAQQEGKVTRKEKEILQSKEAQQKEAMDQALSRLERRRWALQHSPSQDPLEEEEELEEEEVVQRRRKSGAPGGAEEQEK